MTLKIVGTGFLSAEGTSQATRLQVTIAPLLRLVEHAVALCQNGMTSVDLEKQNTPEGKQKILACIILARLLETAEAILTLARGGFSVEVMSATRTFLEAYFIFGNVCKNPAFVEQYFHSDLKVRQKLINQAAKHKDAPFTLINEYADKNLIAQLKEHIEEVGAAELDVYKNASSIGCAGIYDSMYRITSSATHSTPRVLASYVTEALDGTILELKRHPQLGHIARRLHDVGNFLLTVYAGFEEIFELEPSAQVELLRAAFSSVNLPE